MYSKKCINLGCVKNKINYVRVLMEGSHHSIIVFTSFGFFIFAFYSEFLPSGFLIRQTLRQV